MSKVVLSLFIFLEHKVLLYDIKPNCKIVQFLLIIDINTYKVQGLMSLS